MVVLATEAVMWRLPAGAGVPHMYRHIHKFAQIIKHTLYDHMLQRSGKGEIAKL